MKTISTKLNQFNIETLLFKEWLVTNGLGGFACGSIACTPMRKYHSFLTAALPNPYGRTIMLNYVSDTILLNDKSEIHLSKIKHHKDEMVEPLHPVEYRIENGIPTWIYDCKGIIIEKSLLLVHRQNTLQMSYKLLSDHQDVQIKWRPFLHFRGNEQPVSVEIPNEAYSVHSTDGKYEIQCPGYPSLKLSCLSVHPFILHPELISNVFYTMEFERGYASEGALKSPGYFLVDLVQNKKITFIASTEDWNTILALSPHEASICEMIRKRSLLKSARVSLKSPVTRHLVLASDQFLMTPTTRFEDMIRLRAIGEDVMSIIAGFPWFTDWGRDTMISLEGLTLVTGRYRDAHAILHTFSHYLHDGLIPNMFPDGEKKALYNTADATLWFFHAIDRYIAYTNDDEILEFLLPKLESIIQHHINGTQFGIKMDNDGLLIQGCSGYQLTWMDAKVGDWVVTPRYGKAVEINALWYNALKLYETWANKTPDLSTKCYESFNQKFWYEAGSHLYDVIEGDKDFDTALRPNQLFAISLKHPVLQQKKWLPVLESVQRELYTPFGLRTLAPFHPDYKVTYHGDLRTRDAAYHQGTIWPWLLGPYVDVWLKVHPSDFKGIENILSGVDVLLNSVCLETIGEIFDASSPHHPRGCFAQAWSVAEILRALALVDNNQ